MAHGIKMVDCEPYGLRLTPTACARNYKVVKRREAGLTPWGDANGRTVTMDDRRRCLTCPMGPIRTREVGAPDPEEELGGKRLAKTAVGDDHRTSKLTEEKVHTIRRRRRAGERVKDIAADMDVHPTTVSAVVRRKTWRHV